MLILMIYFVSYNFFNSIYICIINIVQSFIDVGCLKFSIILTKKNRSYSTTSETLREVSFNFKEFTKHHHHIYPIWLQWFIGFTEGDGSILTDKLGGISFVITQNESKILYKIKENLGFGSVKYDKSNKTYRFKVLDLPSLIKLTYLFNGNLFLLHRINQLEKWIEVLNSKSINIVHKNTKVKISLQDGWLSGFADAEGCFNVNIFKNWRYVLGVRTKLRFILDQNDKLALESIRDLFLSGNVSARSNNTFRFTAESFSKLNPIIEYFNMFPLRSFKKEAFKKWFNIYSMMLDKKHLDEKGIVKIKLLAKLVNDKTNLNS